MTPPCPICKTPLATMASLDRQEFLAWCGYGPCKSNPDLDASGRTEKEAIEKLLVKLNDDLENLKSK